MGLLRDSFIFISFQKWLISVSWMYNICCSSCFMTWWQRSRPVISVGQAGTVMTPGTHTSSSCWTWRAGKISAMQLCLAGFGYHGGKDAQANSRAFHSISEHSCHWQQEWTTASTKQMPKILETVILPQPHFSCWQLLDCLSLLCWTGIAGSNTSGMTMIDKRCCIGRHKLGEIGAADHSSQGILQKKWRDL